MWRFHSVLSTFSTRSCIHGHYLPLYFALGAAGWGQPGAAEPEYFNREVMYSYLAMDAIAFH